MYWTTYLIYNLVTEITCRSSWSGPFRAVNHVAGSKALRYSDRIVAGACRYLGETHIQAVQFDKSKKLRKKALEIHRHNTPPASVEEAGDRQLIGIVCEAKEGYESAMERLVLASLTIIGTFQESKVSLIVVSNGKINLWL